MKDIFTITKLMLKEKKDVLLSLLFGFLAGIAAVGLFANSGYLISRAALAPPIYVLTVSIALLKLFSVTRAVARYAERYYSHQATFTILSNLRVFFYKKLEALAPGLFHKYRSGDLLSRIVGDVESLQHFFLRVYYPPIVMVMVFLSTIYFVSFFSLAVAGIFIVGLILTGFILPLWFALRQKRIESTVRQQRAILSTETTEFFYGFRELKIHQKLTHKNEQLLHSSAEYVVAQEQMAKRNLMSQFTNQFLALLVSWLVLAFGAYLVTQGELDGLFLAMLVMIALTVFENVYPMAIFPSHYEDSRYASNRLFSITNDKELNTEGVSSNEKQKNREQLLQLQNNNSISGKGASISMEQVSFTFPSQKRKALKDISLRFEPGTKTAIVGPSGSGKSTILQLLLKAYPTHSGRILLNGTHVEEIEQESIWDNTNVVLQHNHFFFGTIRDNLALAKDDLTDEEMLQVLKQVKLEYFTLSHEVLEKGENLSGGEKQRLAIARVLLRKAHLWLLDEPTSSIDVLTEKHIYQQIFQAAKQSTLLLVSHRLTGLEAMDQIIVMESGTIVEAGTFDELMERKGYFFEMKQIEKDVLL
ncbi:thiol reductant ABC exporter subunit CydC [Bacillus horti]|uniref:ATP-binding cassette subfamily C protein CydC n=1 Tax=Caldalkalibacillus horti TaxID=77523 RepID=A0ABT9W3V5_9BACI|nr:thiol reductant ABC exporter subunit CydC [Bacillus horti]MDQ0167928.1 ATP-binding cassette subfamily C protein CydC [Bacillus horti]